MAQHDAAAKPHPLHGMRVLDFTSMMAGPYCTRFLADLGADVIKIESPEGDYIRVREPMRNGASAYFGHLNSGKRSIVLDLKNETHLELAKRLAAEADVLVESFRPGVMKRFGLDYETLSSANPKLIYCSVSGFGQDGPSAQLPAYAQIVQAKSGYDLAFMSYQDNMSKPPNNAIYVADVLVGVYGYSSIVTAMLQRERTGQGQHIDLALMDSMMTLLPYEFQEAQFPAKKRRPVYPPVRTADGYLMIAPVSPRNFEPLFESIGRPDWRDDPLLATEEARQRQWSNVMEVIEAWTSVRSTKECEQIFNQAGVPAAAYRTVREAISDPQFAHRGSFATVRDAGGEFLVPNLPFRMSGACVQAGEAVPKLGEHTAQVLDEVLGLPPEEIEQVVAAARRK